MKNILKNIINFLILCIFPFIVVGIIIVVCLVIIISFILFDFSIFKELLSALNPVNYMWIRILYIIWFFVSLGIQTRNPVDFFDLYKFYKNDDKTN